MVEREFRYSVCRRMMCPYTQFKKPKEDVFRVFYLLHLALINNSDFIV